jgi:hypothetical protein
MAPVLATVGEFHISAVGRGHRSRMQSWFSQIIIGIIVTVVGTVIANSIVSGRGGRHFIPGIHLSGPSSSGR